MDLIAVVSDEENLDVYRLNGQRAFGMKKKSPNVLIDSICWKPNGQAIVIAWSDGLVDIISAETGKALQRNIPHPSKVPQGSHSESNRIRCIGWGVSFIDVPAVKARTGVSPKNSKGPSNGLNGNAATTTTDSWDSFRDDTTLDDFLQRQPDLQTLDISPDLPDQLAMMDIENLLPKLPVIPLPPATPFARPVQTDTSSFTSQAQIDVIFHSHHLKDHNAVDVLIRCMDDGTVNPTIYDSLGIINVKHPAQWSIQACRPLLHASHPYSCSHGLLMEMSIRDAGPTLTYGKPAYSTPQKATPSNDFTTRLVLVPLTLRFISSAGIYLHLIASKTTQLQSLLQYVQQCLQRIRTYWTHSQDLPSKFMRNVEETLAEKNEGDLIQSLYHLAVTGDCPPTIKEWLANELTESGHKRWDHAATQGYAKIIELTHENLLPALDRCSIVISMLRGLARYHDSTWIFNISAQDFTAILDVIRRLQLLAHNVLIYAGDERRQFTVFSRWLRHEIDVQATDPTSASAEEAADRDPGIDYSLLLEYIQGPMSQSNLLCYLQRQADLPSQPLDSKALSYEDTKRAIELSKQGAAFKQEALCLDVTNACLQDLCSKLFLQITTWQAASTSMNCGVVLEEGEVSEARDLRMVFEKLGDSDDITTYIAIVPKHNRNEIRLHRLVHADVFDDAAKSVHASEAVTLSLGNGEVTDVKFVDDSCLIALYRTQDASYILNFTYSTAAAPSLPSSLSSSSTTLPNLPYCARTTSFASIQLPHGRADEARHVLDLSTPERLRSYVKHVFPARERFVPVRLEVNGRKDRRVVCVLGEDLRHYKVFDLDYQKNEVVARREESESESDIEMTG